MSSCTARPLVTSDMVAETVRAVKRFPAVTLGRPVSDTIKVCAKGSTVSETLPRERLWAVQTPQAFQMRELREAHTALGKREATDDCMAVELKGGTVKIISCLRPNFKITTVEDLQAAAQLLK